MNILDFLVVSIYKFFSKVRIFWIARRYGYRITNFEWLPESEADERIVRITPKDNFKHGRDDCPCDPIKTVETDDEDGEYTLIQHREMV